MISTERSQMNEWLFQLRRLKNVNRCGVLSCLRPENVVEHSYFVAIIAYDLAKELEEKEGIKIDYNVLLLKSLLHDIEESIIGDIPYPVKHSSELFKTLFEEEKNKIVDKFFPKEISLINQNSKVGIEGEIVHIADYLELYLYCVEEQISGNHNCCWDEIKDTCRRIFVKDKYSDYVMKRFSQIDNLYGTGGIKTQNKLMNKEEKQLEFDY